jgi:dCMP deaminase
MRTLIAYVPVLHEGYLRFFEKYPGPKELHIFGPEITEAYAWLAKDIRQVDPERMRKAIEALSIFDRVRVLDRSGLSELAGSGAEIIVPDEDITRELVEKHLPDAEVTFDPMFLRWDKHNSIKEKPVLPEERITRDEFHRRVMDEAMSEAQKSSDIWRQVGAAIVKDGEVVLMGHNEHLPSAHIHGTFGDPRNNFHKGDHIEISSSFHGESSLIAEAAKRGIPLEGADMYTTVFPCPPCAKLIAHSGIQTLYCGGGYGVLDGEDILKGKGVRVIFVE